MSENYRKPLENLDLFLADTEGQTTEEIAKELKDQGVDVEEFLSKVKSVVRKGYQGQVRAAAATERQAAIQRVRGRFGDLATKTKEELLSLITAIQAGAFGATLSTTAVARFRNRNNTSLSEEDLRSWLEDLDASEPESKE
jgi:hypothetical protein